jgi:hypothetical protein
MDESARHYRSAILFGLVASLHGALVWFLFVLDHPLRTARPLEGLELFLIPREAPRNVPPPPPNSQPRPRTAATPHASTPSKEAPAEPITSPPSALSPTFDWYGELERAGRSEAPDYLKQPKDFGFPKRPPTTADYPQFDWDYARTHRVETLPQGGLLINLNDNCALIFAPLPMAICGIGKRKANGDLFKHMRDPDQRNHPLP